MSIARELLIRIRDDLRGIKPSGGYSSDLGSRVWLGDPEMAVIDGELPAAWVTGWSIASRDDDHLGAFRRTLTVQIVAATRGLSDDPGDDEIEGPAFRAIAATDLVNDIVRALEGDRQLGRGDVVVMRAEAQTIDGAKLEIPGVGMAFVTATYEYITPAEVGV